MPPFDPTPKFTPSTPTDGTWQGVENGVPDPTETKTGDTGFELDLVVQKIIGEIDAITAHLTGDSQTPAALLESGIEKRYDVDGGVTQANILEMKNNTGCKWIRLGIDVSGAASAGSMGNPTNGFNMGGAATNIAYAKQIGFKVLCTITYSPPWLGTGYHTIPQTAPQRAAYALLCRAIVAGLGNNVDAYEVWNEINHGPFNGTTFSGVAPPTMATIRPFMREMILAMRAEKPDVFIMPSGPASGGSYTAEWRAKWDAGTTPVSSPPPEAGGGTISAGNYIDQLYEAGGIVPGKTAGTPYVDAIAVHAYTGAAAPTSLQFSNILRHSFQNLPGIGDYAAWGGANQAGSLGYNFYQHILTARGDGAGSLFPKKIWQTEGGLHTDPRHGLDESQAANAAQIIFDYWRTYQQFGLAGPYMYFHYRDVAVYGAAGVGNEAYLGLYSKSASGTFSPKQHLGVFKAFNGI